MLLSQQAKLVSFNTKEVEIALSPNWESMIKSRKVVIDNAVKKILGNEITIKFSKNQINMTPHPNSSKYPTKITTQKKDPIKKYDEPKNNSLENNQKNTMNESSKNLADFFNGEIIDFND